MSTNLPSDFTEHNNAFLENLFEIQKNVGGKKNVGMCMRGEYTFIYQHKQAMCSPLKSHLKMHTDLISDNRFSPRPLQ